TELVGRLVDDQFSHRSKDSLAKADFALHSGGAVVIPSLTSPTLRSNPRGLWALWGKLTFGNDNLLECSPTTALHHEIHNGHCWPFAGAEGQLAVTLAHPVVIEEIAIDHVVREVAWDTRSAPRKMELWGLAEGVENLAKMRKWEEQEARTRDDQTRKEVYPSTLPSSSKYMRIASFEYNIDAQDNVQTFPLPRNIRELGIDFGVVMLRIMSNWGREFTCLYRMRVHGK
ncbi:hypothetical protein OF83DRAFT_1022029, partial [Amylostereum chailletii]